MQTTNAAREAMLISLTNNELQAIRAQCEAATPIPIINIFGGQILKIDRDALTDSIDDIPDLLAHIEAQHNTLAKAETDKAALVGVLEECVPVLEAADEFFNGVSEALAKARATLASVKGAPPPTPQEPIS